MNFARKALIKPRNRKKTNRTCTTKDTKSTKFGSNKSEASVSFVIVVEQVHIRLPTDFLLDASPRNDERK